MRIVEQTVRRVRIERVKTFKIFIMHSLRFFECNQNFIVSIQALTLPQSRAITTQFLLRLSIHSWAESDQEIISMRGTSLIKWQILKA